MKIENDKYNAYREYKLRKEENLPVNDERSSWFELFNYRIKNNMDVLTGVVLNNGKKIK